MLDVVKNLLGKWVNGASRDSQEGFTLIEMSIVLAIIGLIVGGILKGQEVINGARMKAQVAQVDAIKAAFTSFQDTYSALPGDYSNAVAQLSETNAVNGDGNGRIGAANLTDASNLSADAEVGRVWLDLTAANLLAGVRPVQVAVVNQANQYTTVPIANATMGELQGKIGNGYLWLGTFTANNGGNNALTGNMVILGATATAAATPTMRVIDAATMDQKYDDGSPLTGSIVVGSTSTGNGATACNNAGAYGSGTLIECVPIWQVQ